MIELLKVIALLCQINSGSSPSNYINKYQIKCHNYYFECLGEDVNKISYYTIKSCTKRRKL